MMASTWSTTPVVGLTGFRVRRLDRLRGLAIVLMVADHVLVNVWRWAPAAAPWATLLRITATRAALPLFCVVMGALLLDRRPSDRRMVEVAALGAVMTLWCGVTGVLPASPDVLVVLAMVLVAWPLVERWPVTVACVAVLQPMTWHVPWSGYQPGVVLGLVLVGWLVQSLYGGGVAGAWLPAVRWVPAWVEWLGRHPLGAYAGHLVVLGLVVAVWP